MRRRGRLARLDVSVSTRQASFSCLLHGFIRPAENSPPGCWLTRAREVNGSLMILRIARGFLLSAEPGGFGYDTCAAWVSHLMPALDAAWSRTDLPCTGGLWDLSSSPPCISFFFLVSTQILQVSCIGFRVSRRATSLQAYDCVERFLHYIVLRRA